MFTIGEFSKVSGLSVKTLRYYHEKGLLVPAVIDPATGYRSYDERNAEMARVIVALRDLEFSLDDIAAIVGDCTNDEDMLDYLERQKHVLGERLRRLSGAVRQIEGLIQQQREEREADHIAVINFEVRERDLEPVLVAGMRMKGRYSDCGQGFAMLGRRLGRHIAGKPLCLYYDDEYRADDADFEPCIPIRRNLNANGFDMRYLQGGPCVSLVHRGPYQELGRSYARILRYAREQGYKVKPPTREVYLKGPGMIFRGNPKRYLTEIQLLVERDE